MDVYSLVSLFNATASFQLLPGYLSVCIIQEAPRYFTSQNSGGDGSVDQPEAHRSWLNPAGRRHPNG